MSVLLSLLERRADLRLYKKLVHVFSAYVDKFPGTAVEPVFNELLQKGMKSLPSDKTAMAILFHMLERKLPDASKVGEIMNLRFMDLPANVRPVFMDTDNTETVAFWKRQDKVYDRIMSLINLEDGAASGAWSDAQGKTVKLLNK